MRPLIISAPFGNYVQPPGATPTLGTFTALRRPGRLWRVLRTVRYYPRLGAWVNKIGLRNPGIDWLAARVRAGRIDASDKIVSVHGFSDAEWEALLAGAAALKPLALELNMSCPNVGEIDWPKWLFARAIKAVPRTIVKLPPVRFEEMARQALDAGVRMFHCCNTLPVPGGGLSGKPLKPIALRCIADLRAMAPGGASGELTIIGGGGITAPQDIDDFAAAGATHFALGTKVMHPRYLWSHARLQPLLQRAAERSPARD